MAICRYYLSILGILHYPALSCDSAGSCRKLQDPEGKCRILQESVGYCRIVQDSAGFLNFVQYGPSYLPTMSYEVGLGFYTQFTENLQISIKVKTEFYKQAVAWLQDLVYVSLTFYLTDNDMLVQTPSKSR
jgi:hypothetical protein